MSTMIESINDFKIKVKNGKVDITEEELRELIQKAYNLGYNDSALRKDVSPTRIYPVYPIDPIYPYNPPYYNVWCDSRINATNNCNKN